MIFFETKIFSFFYFSFQKKVVSLQNGVNGCTSLKWKNMKKIEFKWRKLLRTLFGCVSFTAVAFVFQACYGTKDGWSYSVKLTGTVRSESTHLPIQGIKITVNEGGWEQNCGFTDENGRFDFYASVPLERSDHFYRNDSVHYTPDSVYVRFLDIDGIKNGHFADKTLIINPNNRDEVVIYVELEDKQE